MTDRGRGALTTRPDRFDVGPSSMTWDGRSLTIAVDEMAGLPRPGRVRGTIRVTPSALTAVELPLTADGAHVWRPFAPTTDIEVDLGRDGRWSGHGYFDANFGICALEADFSFWTWGRYPLADGTACFYDTTLRDGTETSAGFLFRPDGTVAPMDPPPRTSMRRSLWAVRRETRADAGTAPRQVLPMLDAPFYCRSAVETRIGGEVTTGVHEALDLDRFRGPWLMPMLAVRVPRRRRWPR